MSVTNLPDPRQRAHLTSPIAPGKHCDCRNCSFYSGDDINPAVKTEKRWDGPLCSGSNADCSYCACSRAETPLLTGGCTNCSIVCGSRMDVGAWMQSVKGTLKFDDIQLDQPDLNLPVLVPQSDGSPVTKFHTEAPHQMWAVGLRRVYSTTTWKLTPKYSTQTPQEAFGVPETTQTLLSMFGTDPIVEAFWARRKQDGLVEKIANQGWDLILPPNYSLYGNWPRAMQMLSYRRTLLVAQEFSDAGATVAPNIYWFRLEDLKRWALWMNDTELKYAAVNLQTLRTAADWNDFLLPGLHWLAENVTHSNLHWLVMTGGNISRLKEIQGILGRNVTFVTQKPWQTAAHGELLNEHGKWEQQQARPVDSFTVTTRRLNQWLKGEIPWPSGVTDADDKPENDNSDGS